MMNNELDIMMNTQPYAEDLGICDSKEKTPMSVPVNAVVMLPCPFCGGEPVVFESDDGMARWVCCTQCESDGPPIDYRFNGSHEEARRIVVEAWNQRRELEQLKGK